MTTKTVPARSGALITKSDSNVLNPPCRAFIIETDGDLTVRFKDSQTVLTMAFKAGAVYPLELDQFRATGSDDVGRILAIW